MPERDQNPDDHVEAVVSIVLMKLIRDSRREPEKCRDDGIGPLRMEVGPHAMADAAPGVPFLHSLVGLSRDRAARALEAHCKRCGACEWARR
jgi:hypothetical protein